MSALLQTGLVGFSFSALNNFVKFKPTEIENIEGIELLRAVFYEMKIFGFEIHNILVLLIQSKI